MATISKPNIKVLAARSGNCCAFPDCQEHIVAENGAILGEMAHIRGEKPGAARYDPSMTDPKRNHYDNLIFLCPNHHTEIDKINPGFYTPEKLFEIKTEHECWAREQCRKRVPEIQFGELMVVTTYLETSPVPPNGGFDVIPIQDKINRNNLSSSVRSQIELGLSRVSLVEQYIQRNPDPEFGNRLRHRFVGQYIELKARDGLTGDDLFDALRQFASGNSADFSRQAAGLTVLVYLFQACDVFEK